MGSNFKIEINKFFFLFISLFSFVYFCTVYTYPYLSVFSQSIIIISILLWYLLHKNIYFDYIILLLISLNLFWQSVYVINFIVLYISYRLAKHLNEKFISKIVTCFAVCVCLFSAFNFYIFNSFLFEDSLLYPHYFFNSTYRLIGLDSSPTILSFTAGLSFLIVLMDFEISRVKKSILLIFFLIIVLLTASRTSAIGLVLSMAVSYLAGINFFLIILLFISFPIAATFLYISYDGVVLRLLLELITSHRVINWSNLIVSYLDRNTYLPIIGTGKPPIVDNPLFEISESNLFHYVPIADTESAILKIIIFHGFPSLILFFFILNRSYVMKKYKTKLFTSYIIFGAIFYDSIISVHYIFIILFLLTIINNDRSVGSPLK